MVSQVISTLYDSSPRELMHQLVARLRFVRSHIVGDREAARVSDELRRLFTVYGTSNLKSITPEEFTRYIHSKIGTIDSQSEGYSDSELDRQRDLSIKFHWGHNHDFGTFRLEGKMGDRHIDLLSNFVSFFPVSLDDFKDKDVLDVGCWTGGTTLLLAALGNRVLAIEEVRKYADMVSFLARSFDLEGRVEVRPASIFDCNSEEFHDRFDVVYFPGVVYHLSDPVLALRILFNSLRVGGRILVESHGIDRIESVCRFEGSQVYSSGTREGLDRSGWNWFVPSPSALYRMMREAGFDDVQTRWNDAGGGRVYGYGRKVSEVGICRAGLSIPGIK